MKKQILRLKQWFKKKFATGASCSRRQKLFFSLSFMGLVTVIYLSVSLLNINRAEVALAKLAESFEKKEICHEECYVWRQSQEAMVVADLKNNSKKVTNRLADYWLAPAEPDSAFKKELIKIMWLAYGTNNPPAYLDDYLTQADSDPRLVGEIVSIFGPGLLSSRELSGHLSDKINYATSTAERLAAIKALREINNDGEIDNYFVLLNSPENSALKREVIKNISAIREKSSFFTLEQLAIIKDLILSSETDQHLRQDLVLLLGDYYLVYPSASAKIWQEVYRNKSLDNISRTFSADNLNHLAQAKLVLPTISPTEWADYYNE